MKNKSSIFLIMIFCMSIISTARSTELANDPHEFWMGITLGLAAFMLGFMWFGMVKVAFGVLFKVIWGNTKIYILFKKWISFTFVLWFVAAFILCVIMWIDSEYASFYFLQCMVSGIVVETWVYKNFLEERLIENIKTNKEE